MILCLQHSRAASGVNGAPADATCAAGCARACSTRDFGARRCHINRHDTSIAVTMPPDIASPASERPEIRPAAAVPAPPCLLVIFGGTGDLTKRLLLPALVNLRRDGLLPEDFAVIGIGRGAMDDDAYRRAMAEGVGRLARVDTGAPEWRWLAGRLRYLAGDIGDAGTYRRLAAAVGDQGNIVFYLAMPPQAIEPIVRGLGAAGLARQDRGWRRVIVEKPFGTDLASAAALNRSILEVLEEGQTYRIDHYLGKETVQNIMVLRFANGIFEPLWNRDHVDHVQISVAEIVGVEQRGAFYERIGALRDMVPNHLFQLLTLTAMGAPTSFHADAVRSEKARVLEAVRPFDGAEGAASVVRGQYGPGAIDADPVPGYRAEPKVDPLSLTETYVAMKVMIDSWRWAGVPFYLRTGKRLARRSSQIAVRFKQAPLSLFRGLPSNERPRHNFLVLQLQPDEGISLRFGAKLPGQTLEVEDVEMSFRYKDYFPALPSTGYETLIYDCMTGDATLFQRADFIEAAWGILQPIRAAWQKASGRELAEYAAGSWGPKSADELLQRDGREWCPMC
jgi:glucose-6-phosphate 1-dehydrogenase